MLYLLDRCYPAEQFFCDLAFFHRVLFLGRAMDSTGFAAGFRTHVSIALPSSSSSSSGAALTYFQDRVS